MKTIQQIHDEQYTQITRLAGELVRLARCDEAAEQMEDLYRIWFALDRLITDLRDHKEEKEWKPCHQ